MEEFLKIFAERLALLRNEKNLSQRELASIIGVGKSTINQYESMERSPKIEQLYKLAKFFNVSVSYLIGESDERNLK